MDKSDSVILRPSVSSWAQRRACPERSEGISLCRWNWRMAKELKARFFALLRMTARACFCLSPISSQLPSRGITGHREHAEPRSGDRRSAIIKIALSPLSGLLGASALFSPHGCRRGPHSCARPGGLWNPIEPTLAPMPPPRPLSPEGATSLAHHPIM